MSHYTRLQATSSTLYGTYRSTRYHALLGGLGTMEGDVALTLLFMASSGFES